MYGRIAITIAVAEVRGHIRPGTDRLVIVVVAVQLPAAHEAQTRFNHRAAVPIP